MLKTILMVAIAFGILFYLLTFVSSNIERKDKFWAAIMSALLCILLIGLFLVESTQTMFLIIILVGMVICGAAFLFFKSNKNVKFWSGAIVVLLGCLLIGVFYVENVRVQAERAKVEAKIQEEVNGQNNLLNYAYEKYNVGNFVETKNILLSYVNKYPESQQISEVKKLLTEVEPKAVEQEKQAQLQDARKLKESIIKNNPELVKAKEQIGNVNVGYKILERNTGKKSEMIRVYVENPNRERVLVALQEMMQKKELGNVLKNQIWFMSSLNLGKIVAEYNYQVSMFGAPAKGILKFMPRGEEIEFPKETYKIWEDLF